MGDVKPKGRVMPPRSKGGQRLRQRLRQSLGQRGEWGESRWEGRVGDVFEVVGWQGLEPWTNALKGHCSTNLATNPPGSRGSLLSKAPRNLIDSLAGRKPFPEKIPLYTAGVPAGDRTALAQVFRGVFDCCRSRRVADNGLLFRVRFCYLILNPCRPRPFAITSWITAI
jgi:hypothetical protein